MDGITTPLGSLKLVPDGALKGSKIAYQIGGDTVLVSPAMYDLIKHADKEELELLLRSIKVKQLPFDLSYHLDDLVFCLPNLLQEVK